MTFGDVRPDRVVVSANGVRIDVRQGSLSIWPKWGAFWEYNGARFCAPVADNSFAPWDDEPTDAEVLAEYLTWYAEKDLR